MDKSLTQFYDELKSEINQKPKVETPLMNVSSFNGNQNSPGAINWRNQAAKECDNLKDGCYKRLLLDIYCKVLPLDSDFVAGNQGMIKSDINDFLGNKGLTATQYLTSGYEKTNAPLLEFILRSCGNIGKEFMREASEKLKDAQENKIDIPPPEADPDNKEIGDQLVDIQKDTEYENFIDKLKQKTVSKIVSDVSKIISDKKEEKNMTFDPNPVGDVPSLESAENVEGPFNMLSKAREQEIVARKTYGKDSDEYKKAQKTVRTSEGIYSKAVSEYKKSFKKDAEPLVEPATETPALVSPAITQGMPLNQNESVVCLIIDHIHKNLWKENVELTPELNEEIIGLAIREATLNMIDLSFKYPDSEFRPFSSRIRFNKGVLVTEKTIKDLIEK